MAKSAIASQAPLRTIVLAAAINVHGVKFPAGNFVSRDEAWCNLLLANGGTEPVAPAIFYAAGEGWRFS